MMNLCMFLKKNRTFEGCLAVCFSNKPNPAQISGKMNGEGSGRACESCYSESKLRPKLISLPNRCTGIGQ